MDSTSTKRKWTPFQDETESLMKISSDTTQVVSVGETNGFFSDENPCRVTRTSNSSDNNDSSNSLPRNESKLSSNAETGHCDRHNDSNEKKTDGSKCLLGTVSGYIKPNQAIGTFSIETPYFSKDTPLILATARQTGSSIMTSYNTDSVRKLQNSYTDIVIKSNASAEYFSNRTPHSSRKLPTSSSSMTSFPHCARDPDDLSGVDIRHIRQNNENLSASTDSQIYMGVMWHSGKLGVAYYNLDTTLMYVMLDTQENDDFELLLKVLKEINPVQTVVSSKQDERLLNVLRNHASDIHSTDEGSAYLQFLPSIDFSTEICKRRVISLDLPSVPEHYIDTERTLYLSSLLPFENICMIRAMGGLLKYLEKMRIGIELEEAGTRLPVLDIKVVTLESQMMLDDTAYSALQIFQKESHPSVYKAGTSNSAKEGLSLFGIMNRTKSHIGSRMLRTWFQRPLKDKEAIQNRHAAISFFNNPRNFELVTSLEESIKNVKNISKILTRMMTSQASVGDWQVLYKTVYSATSIKELCRAQTQSVQIIRKVTEKFTDDLHQVTNYIHKVVDFQECSLQNRFVVKPNVNENLDKKKRMYSGLPEYLTEVAYRELNKLGNVVSLCSIIYIPQIGYLLAIPETAVINQSGSKSNYDIDGLEFVFLINNVLHYRSTGTRELDTLLGDTRCEITDIETSIMHKLQNNILKQSSVLLTVLDICAEFDCLLSLASCAREYSFIRPTITDENCIQVVNGRHPIQEVCCSTFVPNNTQSNRDDGKIKILTGPNACGKSVYLKQVALIVFLAQIGSFVPAEEARLGLIDRIFTRIRSQESVSVGLSTFMIDINQMAESLKSANDKSLCIVDEFGKGTDMRCSLGGSLEKLFKELNSMQKSCCLGNKKESFKSHFVKELLIDGLSLLSSCMRYWIDQGDKCPHIFLSTHFHSIIQQTLIPRSPNIKFLTLETLQSGDELVFLYQLVEGHTSSSYASHVAVQAGLPANITERGIEASELIGQCKPVQRCDAAGSDTQLNRCQTVVSKVLDMDLETADIRSFLSAFVLPVIEGNL